MREDSDGNSTITRKGLNKREKMNKIIRKIESALQTGNGQRFLQYAYSFGAAIVIFGAMVKVLHWWGIWGNIIFGTGMAIECIVFILYGLDRPPKEAPAFHAVQRSENLPPLPVTPGDPADQLAPVPDNVMKFAQATEKLIRISESLQESYRHISQNSMGYVQQMESLNRETEKMTRQIEELNQIYGRMIQAMTNPQPK